MVPSGIVFRSAWWRSGPAACSLDVCSLDVTCVWAVPGTLRQGAVAGKRKLLIVLTNMADRLRGSNR